MKYITQRQIQKLHKIKDIKETAKLVNQSTEMKELEKNEALVWLNDRMNEIREYKKQKHKEELKNKKKYTLYFDKDEMQILEKSQKQAKEFSGKQYTINQIVKMKALVETLDTTQLKEKQQYKETIDFIRGNLRNLGGLATNFNQIIYNYNQRGLFGKTYSLTKEERDFAIDLIAQMEEMVLKMSKWYELIDKYDK